MAKGRKPVNRQFVRTIALTTALLPAICLAQSSQDHVTRIDYYPNGLVSSVTLPDGSFTSYVYDAAQRLTDVVDAEGNSIHYTLDNAGNRIKEEVKGQDGTLRRTLSRVYNQLGQLQTAKDAANNPTSFTYDASGNLDRTTDALNRVTDNDYDPLNRLSKTIQDVGGIAATTQFKYDAQDNLTEVVDPKGLSTKYQYNAFGDLVRLESPDTGVTVYGYDGAGNRTSVLDARNELSTYTYDALNRPTGITYSDATLNVTYTYDAVQPDCEPNESFAIGRLTRVNDGSGETRYCHDRFGNVTRKVQVVNGLAFPLRYAYTKAGQLSSVRYPDGMLVDYVRDGLGRVTDIGVTLSGGTRQVLLSGGTYFPFGPLAGWTWANGRRMSRSFDLNYRAKAVVSSGDTQDGMDVGFAWDAGGNLIALHTNDLNGEPRVTLDYDNLNRLIAFKDGPTGAVIESYSYDATGNRTSSSNSSGVQLYGYSTNSHHLTSANGTARTYDAAGNTVSIGGVELELGYNVANRMDRVERNNVLAAEYTYNARGEQVQSERGTGTTYAVYDEQGRLLGNYTNPQSPSMQTVWLDGVPVGVITNDTIGYIEVDHLGTPRSIVDPVRDVAVWVWDITSEAFGDSAANDDPDSDGIAFHFNGRFPGQRHDESSGLIYNGARDYDPAVGRYVQSDPTGLRGGISSYAYAGNKPLRFIDSTGRILAPPMVPILPPPPPPGAGAGEFQDPWAMGGGTGDPIIDWPPRPRETSEGQAIPDPLPPRVPKGPGNGCGSMFQACLKGASMCGIPGLKQGMYAICLTAYLGCQLLHGGDSGGSGDAGGSAP